MAKTHLEKLRDAIWAFQNLQTKYADFSAGDSEPSRYFSRLVNEALDGEQKTTPDSLTMWELHDERGWVLAARALRAATKKVLELIGKTPLNQVKEVRNLLKAEGVW